MFMSCCRVPQNHVCFVDWNPKYQWLPTPLTGERKKPEATIVSTFPCINIDWTTLGCNNLPHQRNKPTNRGAEHKYP